MNKNNSTNNIIPFVPSIPLKQSEEDALFFSLLDQVCETGSQESLEALNFYLLADKFPDFPVQESLEAFQQKQKELFYPTKKHFVHSGQWLAKRLAVATAAFLLINTFCVNAIGSNIWDLTAQWGDETFRFHSDFQTDQVGGIVYEDRSQMDQIDLSAFIEEEPGVLHEPLLTPKGQRIITHHVRAESMQEVLEQNGISKNLFPTWIPPEFVLEDIKVIEDERNHTFNFHGFYQTEDGYRMIGVSADSLQGKLNSSIIEKDERPVEKYICNGVEFYLMYNLEQVNAVATYEGRELLFYGDITMDEMKKMVDSVFYEVE